MERQNVEDSTPKKLISLTQFLEENNSLISSIEDKYNFPMGTLSKKLYNLIIFIAQIKNVSQDFSTPSKNRDKIVALSNSAKILLLALNRIPKAKITALDKFVQFHKEEKTTPFIYALESKLKFLYNHLFSEATREKYGKYNGDLTFLRLTELLAYLADDKLIKIMIDSLGITKGNIAGTSINSIKNGLRELIKRCKKITPKSINEGRSYSAVTRNFLIQLMAIYEEVTGKQPTIYPICIQTTRYLTPFNDFIHDIFPLVKNALPSKKTLTQIAALACKVLPYYIELKP